MPKQERLFPLPHSLHLSRLFWKCSARLREGLKPTLCTGGDLHLLEQACLRGTHRTNAVHHRSPPCDSAPHPFPGPHWGQRVADVAGSRQGSQQLRHCLQDVVEGWAPHPHHACSIYSTGIHLQNTSLKIILPRLSSWPTQNIKPRVQGSSEHRAFHSCTVHTPTKPGPEPATALGPVIQE